MARPKKEQNTIVVNNVSDDSVDEVLNIIDKLNPDASTLSENSLSTVTDYIDTGNYSLNAIISGSIHGGIPVGRVSGVFGPPYTGKTLILNKIMANAQKKGLRPVYFDSEQALDKFASERLGCDSSKIKHVPIEIIEECKNQIIQTLTKAVEVGLKKKLIIFIDSLGGLNTAKELRDAMENSTSGDMGSRAKQLKSMLNKLTFRAAKSETPIVFSNHIYDNPGDMYPSLVKKQAGGMGPLFIASLLIQLSSTNIKAADDKGVVGALSDKISGTNLRAFITKNRFIPPYLSTEMYLNFKTGLDPYSGLLELCKSMNIVEQRGAVCSYKGNSLGYPSSFEKDPNFWSSHKEILEELDSKLKKELTFSNENYASLKNEVENLDKELANDDDSEN